MHAGLGFRYMNAGLGFQYNHSFEFCYVRVHACVIVVKKKYVDVLARGRGPQQEGTFFLFVHLILCRPPVGFFLDFPPIFSQVILRGLTAKKTVVQFCMLTYADVF